MSSGGRGALQSWVRALEAIKIMETEPATTLPGLIDVLADRHGDRPALLGEDVAFDYRGLAARANRVARWAIATGLEAGETVALLLPNCPDYVALWLGLTRAGCVAALINTNLSAEGLAHCIAVAGPARLIVGKDLMPAAVSAGLAPAISIWVHGEAREGSVGTPALEPALAALDDAPLPAQMRAFPAPADRALLIYTSGTTGLPKAALVTHARIVEWSFWFAGMMGATPDDRLYDCLPLYHSTGGIVAVGAMLVRGGSVVIRRRFSASRFWDDVAASGCTIFQYIGELCRILNATPPHPRERAHKLRLACGNGLQGDVWTEFVERFALPQVLEFYAATEGSVSLYNCEGKPGAIGRIPPFLAHRFPIALIRCEAETATVLRDAAGRCIPCGTNEIGEAIGQIRARPDKPARQFDGYTDAKASEAKVLCDVFEPGDRWFRTGDLMRKDAAGYFYFIDRLGDTFRWKGENVATTEVAAVLRACPGVIDALVYGVAVPGHEGRAGMAALTTAAGFDFDVFREHLAARLPDYAQPLFVRTGSAVDLTGTFKPTKARLVADGYGPAADPVWFNDRAQGRFVRCDEGLRAAVASGTRRL